MTSLTRRDFLSITTRGLLVISSLVGIGALIRFLSFEPEPPPPKEFMVGSVNDFPLQSRTVLPDIPALLVRSTEGFKAYSLICPHLGCTVRDQAGVLSCPCHGSRFDEEGHVTKRPASNPLETLRVEVNADGQVIVYG